MKTQTAEAPASTSQPGNVSVRELAKSLTKAPATAPETEKTETAEAAASPETREDPAPRKRKGKAAEQAQVETEEPKTGSTEGNEENEETPKTGTEDGEAEPEQTEGEDTTEETPTEEAPAATLSDEASKRLNAELGPLIEELQTAGAKGALQILQKRIPKLVDQRDTERNGRLQAEEQNAQLRKELQDARGKGPGAPQGNGNGATHPRVAQVSQEIQQVDHWLGWCSENADGGTVPNGKDSVELNAVQVRRLKTEMEHARTELLVKKAQTESEARSEYQQAFKEHHTAAVSNYPWMKNQNAPEHQEMQAILQAAPGFKAFPDYELMIGDFLAGKALRTAKAKANGNGTVRRPAPQREPTRVMAEPPGSAAVRKAPDKAKKDEADSRFQKSGSVKDLASSFAATRRASRSE